MRLVYDMNQLHATFHRFESSRSGLKKYARRFGHLGRSEVAAKVDSPPIVSDNTQLSQRSLITRLLAFAFEKDNLNNISLFPLNNNISLSLSLSLCLCHPSCVRNSGLVKWRWKNYARPAHNRGVLKFGGEGNLCSPPLLQFPI
jgi:hypothetical protein